MKTISLTIVTPAYNEYEIEVDDLLGKYFEDNVMYKITGGRLVKFIGRVINGFDIDQPDDVWLGDDAEVMNAYILNIKDGVA